MARTDTLPHFLTDVADAIRTKGGTSETIQASSFDTAIANLPSGGDISDYFNSNIGKGTNSVPGFAGTIKKLPAFSFSGTDAGYMFRNYAGTTLDLSNFNTANCTSYAYMFNNCSNITELDLSSFTTTNITNFNGNMMFNNCYRLTKLDIRNMEFSKISNKNSTFDSVLANCLIIVKDQTEKNFFNTEWPRLTNVKTKDEYENE